VVPRKRSLISAYRLVDEDGKFGPETSIALGIFRESFGMGGVRPNPSDPDSPYRIGNTKADFTDINGEIRYGSDDDTTDTFRKLTKDYGLRADPDVTRAYLDRIIDKETLIGGEKKDSDTIINGKTIPGTGTKARDTGLYELYANVVKRFVEVMIAKGEEYRLYQEKKWFSRTYRLYQEKKWFSRTDTEQGSAVEGGNGVSYCYGCKDDVKGFDEFVSPCKVPDSATIRSSQWSTYRGNLSEDDCQVNQESKKQWPGMLRGELDTSTKDNPFWPTYWSGVDCSGFVQRLMLAAKAQYESAFGLSIDVTNLIFDHETERVAGEIGADSFLLRNRSFRIGIEDKDKIKRGDIVQYEGHISIVYSEKASDSGHYRIIHAYGVPRADLDNDPTTPMGFARRVLITANHMISSKGRFPSPTGFGRIRLWE